ncbi:MAG: 4Fe-4S dicluster domain-containing protein [Candidatus Omnitrophota bacterium]
MPHIKIDQNKCKGCELCVVFCPKKLISVDKKLNVRGVYPAVFSGEACTGCCFCALICPDCAIEVYK